MTTALRLVSTNKGHDPREFALMAFGGGGAMHAVALAEELKVPKVIIPVNSSVFSAWGMLLTDLRRDYIRTHLIDVAPDRLGTIRAMFAEIEALAIGDFAQDDDGTVPRALVRISRRHAVSGAGTHGQRGLPARGRRPGRGRQCRIPRRP
jgi:N-methylhydantoinase A